MYAQMNKHLKTKLNKIQKKKERKKALYHLSHISSPFRYDYFGDEGLMNWAHGSNGLASNL
jgi:hypothetical protein